MPLKVATSQIEGGEVRLYKCLGEKQQQQAEEVRIWLRDDSKVLATAQHMFKEADTDKSGFIEASEVKRIFSVLVANSNLGPLLDMPSDNDMQRHLVTADTNEDGKVSIEEWAAFLANYVRNSVPPEPDEMEALPSCVVIDCGTLICKAGISGESSPRVHIDFKAKLSLKSPPIERGIVTDWDSMEKIWGDTFYNVLKVNPEEHPVLVTEVPLNPKANRERMTRIMFETFHTPLFYVAIGAVVSLFGTQRSTGVVFESGDSCSHVVPIYEGYAIPHAIQKMDVAGSDLTSYMLRLLGKRGKTVSLTDAQNIKEMLSYVALDFDQRTKEYEEGSLSDGTQERKYELLDGKIVSVGDECFIVPEVLFKPQDMGFESEGIQDNIFFAVQKCDVDIRKDMFANIVISGGNACFEGMSNRLNKEIASLAPSSTKVKVVQGVDPRNLAWVGASLLASCPGFMDMWITMEDYEERGPEVVHKKCF